MISATATHIFGEKENARVCPPKRRDECGKFDELMESLHVQIWARVELRVSVREQKIPLHCVNVNTCKNAKVEDK